MKFYNSIGPNPHVVRMFMAEKGLKIPFVEVDLMKGENRKEPYLKVNPHGQMPSLELDDGSNISEILAEYSTMPRAFFAALSRSGIFSLGDNSPEMRPCHQT